MLGRREVTNYKNQTLPAKNNGFIDSLVHTTMPNSIRYVLMGSGVVNTSKSQEMYLFVRVIRVRSWFFWHMKVSTQNPLLPKSTKSRNSNFSVQIQIKPKSQFEFVPQDTEKSEFLNLADFGGVTISVKLS